MADFTVRNISSHSEEQRGEWASLAHPAGNLESEVTGTTGHDDTCVVGIQDVDKSE